MDKIQLPHPRSFQVLLPPFRLALLKYPRPFEFLPQLEPQKKQKAKRPSKVRPSLPPSKQISRIEFLPFFFVVIQTKMMSIFSSFEALCAESRGQKVTFSFSPAKAQPPPADSPAPAAAEKARSVAGGKPLPPGPKQPQKKRAPRFAPELDGVHCFETILPY